MRDCIESERDILGFLGDGEISSQDKHFHYVQYVHYVNYSKHVHCVNHAHNVQYVIHVKCLKDWSDVEYLKHVNYVEHDHYRKQAQISSIQSISKQTNKANEWQVSNWEQGRVKSRPCHDSLW